MEIILSVFMAPELSYDDYKRIESITVTRNIIYPILDVLRKASEKLGVPDVTVDAVIVIGGMSKFYMVNDRLKEFFGFEPIVALDPDQAVARGAAVYHYYLHKYEEMKDDMRLLGQEASKVENRTQMPIQWGNNILNDCLYLGVKNGAVHEIIPTGAELPYTSSVMTGFRIEAGQNKLQSRSRAGILTALTVLLPKPIFPSVRNILTVHTLPLKSTWEAIKSSQ